MRTLQPAVSGSVTVHKVTFSASTCMLRLFEISSANDQNLSELMSILSELMPFGMGLLQSLCHLVSVLSRACAYWHGFGLAWLMPVGMGEVNIAIMPLCKL